MTAVLEDLRALPDEALAAVYSDADDETSAAALREAARRDREDRLAEARGALAGIRAEGDNAMFAQYLAADRACRGELLSREGKAAFERGEISDEQALWRMPEERAMRYASEELRDLWQFVAPRITAAAYVRQRATEARMARQEAREAAGSVPAAPDEITSEEATTDGQHEETGPVLAGHEPGSFRRDLAAEEPEGGAGAGRPLRAGGCGAAEGEAGRADGAGARRPAGPVRRDGRVRDAMTAYTTFGDIEPLETEYLLEGYPKIPRGDVTLFYGDGSIGKGRMLCAIMAEVANAGGTVITVLPEDHPNEQVAPRLRAAGVADLSRVIDMTRLPGGSRLKLSADMTHDGDIGHLRQAVEELNETGHKVRLLVIDPLAAVVGWGSITTNAGARRLVEPLQDLAMTTGIAVCVVAHTVKSGVLQGSAGLQQALRLIYKVSKDPANPMLRILHPDKANNLVAEDLRFTIEEDDEGRVRVVWMDRAEQDRRNKSWRTPAADDGQAAPLAGVHQMSDAVRARPDRAPAGGRAPQRRFAALAALQLPGQDKPKVTVLAAFPGDERGSLLARAKCEAHPAFRRGAQWMPGLDGGELVKFTTATGTVWRFAVAAV